MTISTYTSTYDISLHLVSKICCGKKKKNLRHFIILTGGTGTKQEGIDGVVDWVMLSNAEWSSSYIEFRV